VRKLHDVADLAGKFQKARTGEDPAWCDHVVGRLAATMPAALLPFRGQLLLEWTARRLLGQPLSTRAWHAMTFNDKITYRRLRVRDPSIARCCDKLRTRAYVLDRLGTGSVPELLWVGDDPSEVARRPGPYVLKANHGSAMVEFVGEGTLPSTDQLRESARWLAVDYGRRFHEWGYGTARRLVLAEELLRNPDGTYPPPDFKLFMFDGNVAFIEVVPGASSEHGWALMRPDWTCAARSPNGTADERNPDRPPNLQAMLETASHLAQGWDFLRVDLYDTGDRVLVGELTPYPGGGNARFSDARLNTDLGRMWRTTPRRPVRDGPP
jgi:hypothetical protein